MVLELSQLEHELDNLESHNVDILRTDDSFEFTHLDTFCEQISSLISSLENSEYHSDDDRKVLAHARARVNKYLPSFKTQLKDIETTTFGNAKRQLKDAQVVIQSLSSSLAQHISEIDEKYASSKLEIASQAFEQAMVYHDSLSISFQDILDKRWVNRSISENTVRAQVDERIESIIALSNVINSVDHAIEILQSTQWNLTKALSLSQQPIESDDEDSDIDNDIEHYQVLVTLPKSDFNALTKIAATRGWTIELQ